MLIMDMKQHHFSVGFETSRQLTAIKLPRSIAQSYEPDLHLQHAGVALTSGVFENMKWLQGFVNPCRICTGSACNI